MRLVFAHDHKLRYINGKYYTTGGLSDEITGRYLQFFDHLTIFCRSIPKQQFDTNLFELKNPNITVKPVSHGSLILNKASKIMMEEEIKNSDALIVKLHSLIAEQAIKFARKYNKPYLVEMVGDPWDAYWNHGILGKLIAPRMTLSTKKEVKRAPFVIYVTNEYLEKKYPTDGRWIGCSDVNIKKTDSDIIKRRVEKIKKTNNCFTIGTLAQVDVPYKGQKYVIQAISKLKEKGIVINYLLAGSGNPSFLKKIAKHFNVLDQVTFCGVLSHEDVFQWIDNLDIYIQPSKQEGLPRSVVEALSRACPVIGSKTGGIPELINKKYLFKKGDYKDLVKIIAELNEQELEKMAIENFQKSKLYESKYLENKRCTFLRTFVDVVTRSKR